MLLVNCKNKENDNKLQEPITSINVDQPIEDTLYIEAGDFFNDLSIVRLETSSSNILGNIYGIIRSDEYFIIKPERGSYLFTHDGCFLRELYKSGRGPEEFVSPRFSHKIINNMLFLEDMAKRQDRYYGIGLESCEIKVIEKPLAWHTHDFLVNEEGTITAFGQFVPEETNQVTVPSRIIKNGLFFQDMNGNLISNYDLGFGDDGSAFGLAEMHYFSGEILLTFPRGESILRIQDNKADTIWTNYFEKKFNRREPGSYSYVSLIYYSSDRVLLQKQEVERVSRQNAIGGRHARKGILLVDRHKGTTKVLKTYFNSRNNALELTKFDFTRDGYLCKVLYGHQILEMMKDPEMEAYLNKLIRKGSYFVDEPISMDDNPLLLIGRISD